MSNYFLSNLNWHFRNKKDDGLTKKYVPEIYPAVPSFKLMVLAHKYAPKAVFGIIRSQDGFYMDDNAEQEAFWS